MLLATGLLPGAVSLGLAVVLLAAVPTAPDLSRRLAVNGSVLVGWAPLLWWVRWPVAVDHGALVVALSAGALTVLVTASDRPLTALRGLAPRVHAVDSLLPVAAALALTCTARWAFAGSPRQALVALLPGADNYAHFHMFSTLRAYGATTRALGDAGDGSGWGFDEYPQGFHALAATLSELMHPSLRTGPGALVAYTQVVSVVVVLGLVVLTAAVISLPGLRRRPLVTVPAVVLTWTAFLWEPGQDLLADGFANFWLAAAAVGTALVLALAPRRPLGLPEVVAVAGLMVAVAHMWAPLLVLAGPAVLALFHPFRLTLVRRSLRPRLGAAVAVLGIAALGVLKALVALIVDVDVKTVVTAFGGIHGTSPMPAFVLLLVGGYVCLVAPTVVARRPVADADVTVARRVRLLGLMPLAGLALGGALLVAQLRTVGTSSYYFLKFFMGFELVLAAFVPAVVAVLVASAAPRRGRPVLRVGLSVVATLLATQAFGRLPGRPAPLFDADRGGTASVGAPLSVTGMADGIIAAARAGRAESFRRDYLALGPDRAAQAFYTDGWYHAVLASLSADTKVRLDVLRLRVSGVADAAPVARRLLEENADVALVVDPRYVEPLRRLLGDDLGPRVLPTGSRRRRRAAGLVTSSTQVRLDGSDRSNGPTTPEGRPPRRTTRAGGRSWARSSVSSSTRWSRGACSRRRSRSWRCWPWSCCSRQRGPRLGGWR